MSWMLEHVLARKWALGPRTNKIQGVAGMRVYNPLGDDATAG